MRSGVFLERDGILNLVRMERQHPISPLRAEDFCLNGDACEPLRRLKQAGYLLIATTNQPGISSGLLLRHELAQMHDQLRQRFHIDDVLVCPHSEEDRCPCRKPKAGLLREAAFKWHLDLEHSFVVSDKWYDADAAHNAGCMSIIIRAPWNGAGHHDMIVSSLAAAADKILQLQPMPVIVDSSRWRAAAMDQGLAGVSLESTTDFSASGKS
jgi:D-glycero-D-manno-heptose 1,7-bisphosphate phosphatase